ncbi:MAG: rod shape-determining protein MreC [Clostridia bacterium]|nr:rod shape-determining protein MreC [Clostridia bacterium]
MLRLFRNKLFVVILVTVTIFIIMGVTATPGSRLAYIGDAVSVPLSPFQSFFSFIGEKVEGSFTFFKDMKELKKENEELKTKVDELENERRNLLRYEKENKELRDALNLKNQFSNYESVGGNIIAKDVGNWFNIFTIDRGNSDGITDFSPVITSKGLVGCVNDTMPFTSKVLSIIDVDSTVSVLISKYSEMAIVRGDLKLKDEGFCRMDNIGDEIELSAGDTIETSGMGGIYPRGILVGRVKETRRDSGESRKYAVIEPAVDFKKLQEVFVLKSKNKNTDIGSAGK